MNSTFLNTLLRSSGIFFALVICLTYLPDFLSAQVQGPDQDNIFEEDSEARKSKLKADLKKAIKSEKPLSSDIQFDAPTIDYSEDGKEILGSGGVLVARGGVQMQAQDVKINLETNDAELSNNVLLTWPEGSLRCDRSTVNLDTEVGKFENAEIRLEDGEYLMSGAEIFKDTETEYRLFDANLSTCNCPDGGRPWSIKCDRAEVEQEGYAHTYGTTLRLYDVPFFYTPYLVVPVKQKRQSGLLVPRYGYSSRDGILLDLPFFAVIDDHSDATIRPFIETKTRAGLSLDYREIFSRKSNLASRVIYSNESARDGELRGTITDGLDDPTFDEDRFGGFLRQNWRSDSDVLIPTSLITDVHYVSDDLFLRELGDNDIGRRSDRYTTSRALLRSSFGSHVTSEVSGEYNQSLLTDDDLVFQRLPEIALNGRRSFRPFGFNPYGLKLVTSAEVTATDFVRKRGFDGWRYNINPGVKLPHHYKNYLNGEFGVELHHTTYNLDNTIIPDDSGDLVTDDQRTVADISYSLSTALERVYKVPEDSWLTYLTSLGTRNQVNKLRRVKHTIEPLIKYRYVPFTDQDGLPLFDSLDRIRQKSLFTYGVRTELLGRFIPENAASDPIIELTPEINQLPIIGTDEIWGEGTSFGSGAGFDNINVRKGEIRRIAYLGLTQNYDYVEDRKNRDPDRSPFSDMKIEIGTEPTKDFGIQFESNFDAEAEDFSSWGVSTHFRDDRGDLLRARYTYVEDNISQIEGNLELRITDRIRFGGYTRYDERDSEFIESRAAFRLVNACKCWHIDLGVIDNVNPDKTSALVSFTLRGLGDIAQDVRLGDDRELNQ